MRFSFLSGLGFGREKEPVPRAGAERILPEDIRYALRYREAKLGPEDIKTLARNGFESEALYLFLKAATERPSFQLESIQKLAQIAAAAPLGVGQDAPDPSVKEKIKELVLREIDTLPKEVTVQGGKLAQLSRQGFDYWAQKYREVAKRYAAESSPTFLVGNATFVGLAPFIAAYAATNKPLYILIPSFIHDNTRDACGYRIENGRVELLPKNFARDSHSTVIDDTTQTGNTMNDILKFWTEDGRNEQPHFVSLSITPAGAF